MTTRTCNVFSTELQSASMKISNAQNIIAMSHKKEITNMLNESIIYFKQFVDPTTNEEHLEAYLRYATINSKYIAGAIEKHDPDGIPWIHCTREISTLCEVHPETLAEAQEQILQNEQWFIEQEIEFRKTIMQYSIPQALITRLEQLKASDTDKSLELSQIRKTKNKGRTRTR